jgi:biotin carboxyl carrier protein
MRYYFINQDMEENRVDLEVHPGRVEFKDGTETRSLQVRTLAGKRYCSFDGVSWRKLPALGANEVLVSNSEVYKVYRGFKPSGLNKGGAGALITQMPGKVVKVLKQVGDQVSKGETVLILEAMKMENEIKAGADGLIKSVNVKEGQALDSGFLMVEIGD